MSTITRSLLHDASLARRGIKSRRVSFASSCTHCSRPVSAYLRGSKVSFPLSFFYRAFPLTRGCVTIKRNHRVRLRSFSSSSSSCSSCSLLRSLCLARSLALCSSIRRTEITLIDVINDIIRRATDKRAPAVVYTLSRGSRQNKTRGKRNTLLRGLLSCRSTGARATFICLRFSSRRHYTMHDVRRSRASLSSCPRV